MSEPRELLPVHGFVLAGGRSSRMGRDKALLPFCGRPMVQIAVEKLRSFCADVSIAGNRDDLASFAPVVEELRKDVGPAAGIEAGLKATRQPWALFIPVDVPLIPRTLLQNWAKDVIRLDDEEWEYPQSGAYLYANGARQPAFCILPAGVASAWAQLLDQRNSRLVSLLEGVGNYVAGDVTPASAKDYVQPAPDSLTMEFWFSNVNTPQELAEAEAWAQDPEWKLKNE